MSPPDEGSGGESASVRVLHVDDEPGFAELTAEFLERHDDRFDVETATTVAEGLDTLGVGDYDCVVSDYDMPERTGIDFLTTVRESHPDLPFVLFTGKGSEEVASEAISAGVTDYLQKEAGTEQYAILANRITNVVAGLRSRYALAERKRRIETLISNLPGIVYRCSNEPGWPMEVIEGECDELTGYPATAIESGEVVWGEDLVHPEDRDRLWDAVQDALSADEPFEVSYRIETADGELRYMWERGRGVGTTDDGPIALEGFIADVTTMREHEAELERTNTLLSSLFDALPVGVVAESEEREVITANSRLFELLDLSGEPADAVGRDCAVLAERTADAFADPEAFAADIDALVAARNPADEELVLADGRTVRRIYRPIEFAHGDGHLWVYQDVSDRANHQRELERFEKILEATGDPVYTLDAAGRFTYVNDTLLDTTGYDHGDLIGEPVSAVMDDEDIRRAKEDIRSLLSSDGRRRTIEVDIHTSGGECIPFELHISLLPFDDEFRGTVGVLRDISHRRDREERLDSLRDRVQDLMYTETVTETANVAIRAADDLIGAPLSGVHLYNERTEALEPEATIEGVADSFDEIPRYPSDAEPGTAAALVWETFDSGEPLRIDDSREYEALTEPRPARSVILHPIGSHGMFIVSSDEPHVFDDTEEALVELLATSLRTALDRVEREAQLRDQRDELRRRNERLDQFASIVSHDLRNPLSVAKGNLELVREEVENERLDAVARAHDRMNALIDDLLTIARQGDEATDIREVDLATLAVDCWSGVETHDATFDVATEAVVLADRGRLRQAIENLVRNAVEHGGDGVAVTLGDLPDGFYIADDGPGIPPDRRESVFDAGTSTRHDGTGFGLAIVDGVADAHGWDVSIGESESGGARFEFTGVEFA